MSPKHSIVIPVFNEAQGIEPLFARMRAVADRITQTERADAEVIFVDDGSRDGSDEALDRLNQLDARFKTLHFSRNFGHQVAISAGMEWATGDTVTVMDADLQDPPELILEFLAKWREGFEVVYAVRRRREGETPFKLWTAKMFYRLIRKLTHFDIPVDTGDFRLMDRKAVDAFLRLPERNRFVRGLVAWVGYRQTGVLYDRESRKFGETHYPFRKMLRFALDGVTAFSSAPLQLAMYAGTFTAAASFIGILWALYARFFTRATIPGWTSIMIVVLFLGGVQLLALGIMGEYLGRVFDEVRARPLYFVGRSVGFERQPHAN
ncbi:MAG: glycosyltransferase family 2 protein [Deltaproteobacteria bacterium]|nr:glycosyltransferase family 2 protein [Deltaproteobacteria bacterium]